MSTPLPFVRDLSIEYGVADTVSPLIRRVVAKNPSAFTFKGTGTYIVGRGTVAVIDPGPLLDEHVAALQKALAGETVSHILITHTHVDHSPAAAPFKAPFNETHWPPKSGPGSNYIDLYKQARAQVDESKRCDIVHEMQMLEFNYGGYIIPFFNNLVDSYSTKVSGFVPSKATQNLDSFGHGYRTIWFN